MKILAVLWAFFCAGIMCLAAYSVAQAQQRPHGSVTLTTTAATIGTAASRSTITVKADDDNTVKARCGQTGVTSTSGFELGAGQGITVTEFADLVVQCAAESGSPVVHFWEARR